MKEAVLAEHIFVFSFLFTDDIKELADRLTTCIERGVFYRKINYT